MTIIIIIIISLLFLMILSSSSSSVAALVVVTMHRCRQRIIIIILSFLIILTSSSSSSSSSSSVAALVVATQHRCRQRNNSYCHQYNYNYSSRHKQEGQGRLLLLLLSSQRRNSINCDDEDNPNNVDNNNNDVECCDADSNSYSNNNSISDNNSNNNNNYLIMSRRKFIPQQFFVASVLTTSMTMNNVGATATAITITETETTTETKTTIIETSSSSSSMTTAVTVPPQPPNSDSDSDSDSDDDTIVVVPLEYISTLNAYIVRYTLFEENFAAIIDTGSPFLTVPNYCKQYRSNKFNWGCYRPEKTTNSGYENTIEGFDNAYGTVVWRKANFSFYNNTTIDSNTNSRISSDGGGSGVTINSLPVVFGVLDISLLNGPGGVNFGLIKTTRRGIRPSFLEQTNYKSFCIDLRHHNNNNNDNDNRSPKLILSKRSMIVDNNIYYIPLVQELYRRFQAPVIHYTALASKFIVNGRPLLINSSNPLYVIFDTGVSGMIVSQELFDGRYLQARTNHEKSLWGTVDVTFETITTNTNTKSRSKSKSNRQQQYSNNNNEDSKDSNNTITLSAIKPVTTPLGLATPWKGFGKKNLIVIGLAFLDNLAMTIDIDDGKILFTK